MCGVFYHSVIQGLGFFIHFMIEIMKCKTIKHAFFIFYFDRTWVCDISEHVQGPIYIITVFMWVVHYYCQKLLWHAFDTKHHPVPSQLPFKGKNMFQVCPSLLLTIFTARYFWLFRADFEVLSFICFINS